MRENHCEAKFCLDKKTDNAWGKTIWALLKHSETKLLLWNIVHEYREKVWSRITKSTKHVLSYITMGQALICFTFLNVFSFMILEDSWRVYETKVYLFIANGSWRRSSDIYLAAKPQFSFKLTSDWDKSELLITIETMCSLKENK